MEEGENKGGRETYNGHGINRWLARRGTKRYLNGINKIIIRRAKANGSREDE